LFKSYLTERSTKIFSVKKKKSTTNLKFDYSNTLKKIRREKKTDEKVNRKYE